MFDGEAMSLKAISDTETVRVPKPIKVHLTVLLAATSVLPAERSCTLFHAVKRVVLATAHSCKTAKQSKQIHP